MVKSDLETNPTFQEAQADQVSDSGLSQASASLWCTNDFGPAMIKVLVTKMGQVVKTILGSCVVCRKLVGKCYSAPLQHCQILEFKKCQHFQSAV